MTVELGAAYWRARYRKWPAARSLASGYTLLMPVPGDLPFFLELALKVVADQVDDDRVEILVVPDTPDPRVRALVAASASRWSAGHIRVVDITRPERYLLPRLKNPHLNYGVQLLSGLFAARGSHVILHDADLFLFAPDTLQAQYRRCADGHTSVLGVSPVWDAWFAERGLKLVATWELCASLQWFRRFAPYELLGRKAEIAGEVHDCDITLYAQAMSPAAEIARQDLTGSFEHFNYVVGTYRRFQRHIGSFLDQRFLLLLVRLLIDAVGDESPYQVPSVEVLAQGLEDTAAPVTYPAEAAGYAEWREKLVRVLQAPWFAPASSTRALESLAPFDTFYAGSGS